MVSLILFCRPAGRLGYRREAEELGAGPAGPGRYHRDMGDGAQARALDGWAARAWAAAGSSRTLRGHPSPDSGLAIRPWVCLVIQTLMQSKPQ